MSLRMLSHTFDNVPWCFPACLDLGGYTINCSRCRNRISVAQKAVWRISLQDGSQSCFPNCANRSAANKGMLFRKWRERELCCGDGFPVLREGTSWLVTHTHSSSKPRGVCPLRVIPQIWCKGLVRLVRVGCQREVVWDSHANSPVTQIWYADMCF